MRDGMKSARSALLKTHEEQIAEHLTKSVYTGDHFALLRLVGGMSKRLCGLIEQALKYVYHADGTKTKQRLHPDKRCSTPAPPIFSLKAINSAENKAEVESGIELRQHEDKKRAWTYATRPTRWTTPCCRACRGPLAAEARQQKETTMIPILYACPATVRGLAQKIQEFVSVILSEVRIY